MKKRKFFAIAARLLIAVAILSAVAIITKNHWPTRTAGEFAQMIAMLGGAVWLSIGILRSRILGFVRRAFYDPKTERVKWKTVGVVFRWKYDSECHGKLIDVPASTTKKANNGTRTDNQRSMEIVRQHYLTMTWWGWRKMPVQALNRISVCGHTFRIEGKVADTPTGLRYPLNLNRNPANFSLADGLELRDQLAQLSELVRGCENENLLAMVNSRELLDEAVRRTLCWKTPFYGGVIHYLHVFLPTRYSPSFDDLTENLRKEGNALVEGAMARNEERIERQVALLRPRRHGSPNVNES